jgi:hypothetical protein
LIICASSSSAPRSPAVGILDFSQSPNLFGLYRSRFAALERLKQLADEYQLCHNEQS